jgi:spore coat protein U-like protein
MPADAMKSHPPRFAAWWLSLLFALAPIPAHAIAVCTVSAVGPVVTYDPNNSMATNGAGSVTVNCSLVGIISLLVAYQIQFSTGSSNSFSQRTMNNLSDQLGYNLYTDAARSIVWGNGSPGTSVVSDGYLLGLGPVIRDYPIYLQIPPSQFVPAGVYNDTITITLVY